jgi:hypothetical protein
MNAQMGSRDKARRLINVSSLLHAPAAEPLGKKPGTHCTRDWVGPGPARTGAENLASTGFPSRDRPARSESLYRLSYRGPTLLMYCLLKGQGTDGCICGLYAALSALFTLI